MNVQRRFIFRLAGHLNKTVAELENSMSHKELIEWQEYFTIEPFGADRNELMLATLTAVLFNANYKHKKNYTDFMFTLSKEQRESIKNAEIEHKIKSFFEGLKNGS